jgi:nitrate/nitrite transporter NarK
MYMGLATAAFWLFLAVVVGSLIWRKGLHRREMLITLRAAIEKGIPLDDERLRSLLAAHTRPSVLNHDFLLVLGGVVAAGGLCLFVLALFGAEAAPFLAVGVCTEIMAAALVLLWRVFARREQRDGTKLR